MRRGCFIVRHPWLLLLALLAFYALMTIGLINGQKLPNDSKNITYVMSLLPMLAIFWASRKAGIPTIAAGALALIGPAVFTWAFWFYR